MSVIVQAFYLFLPAYVAKYAPRLAKRISYGNRRVFPWSNLSLLSLITALVFSVLAFAIQKYLLFRSFPSIALIDYADFSLLYGFLLGLGGVVGDVANDWYKNYYKLPENVFWDKWSFMLGALVFTLPLYVPDVLVVVSVLILASVFEFVVQYGMKRWKS